MGSLRLRAGKSAAAVDCKLSEAWVQINSVTFRSSDLAQSLVADDF
jgi:hypothetical protein